MHSRFCKIPCGGFAVKKNNVCQRNGHGDYIFHRNEVFGPPRLFPPKKIQFVSFSGQYCARTVQEKHKYQANDWQRPIVWADGQLDVPEWEKIQDYCAQK
jgi:hypothetical protein